MSNLDKFVRLPRREQALLVVAWWILMAELIGLRVMPYRRIRGLTEGLARVPRVPWGSPMPLHRIMWAVETAGRFIPDGRRCLPKALAAYLLASRHGYVTSVRIGVMRDGEGSLEAHAWLEHEDRVVMGRIPGFGSFTALHARGA